MPAAKKFQTTFLEFSFIENLTFITIDEFESEFSTKHFPQVIHDHQDGRKHIGGAAEVAAYFKENNIAVPAK